MKIQSAILLNDLIHRTQQVLNQAEQFNQQSTAALNWKPDAKSWSILECFEHLNRYSGFYLPEIGQQMQAAQAKPAQEYFSSGWLGNYFAKSMLPKEQLNKMKTFKSMNPLGSDLERNIVDKFIRQQKQLLDLLDKARMVDLQKVKTSITISTWIKLRLGDTFRVLIYHNQRHMVQADKVLKNIPEEIFSA